MTLYKKQGRRYVPTPEREPLPAVNLARRLRALAAQMDELAGDVTAHRDSHWADGRDLEDWAAEIESLAKAIETTTEKETT